MLCCCCLGFPKSGMPFSLYRIQGFMNTLQQFPGKKTDWQKIGFYDNIVDFLWFDRQKVNSFLIIRKGLNYCREIYGNQGLKINFCRLKIQIFHTSRLFRYNCFMIFIVFFQNRFRVDNSLFFSGQFRYGLCNWAISCFLLFSLKIVM